MGTYNIQVKDSIGELSEIFVLTIREQTVVDVSCEDDPDQDKCTVDQTIIDNICVDIPVCTDDQTLIDNTCIDDVEPDPEPKTEDNTGCFGSLGSNSIALVALATIGGSALYFLRKKN